MRHALTSQLITRIGLVGLVLVFGFASAAEGSTILYNNLGAGVYGSESIASYGPLADSFSTGGVSFWLEQVTVDFAATDTQDGGSVSVSLLSDASTSPGSVLDSIGTIDDSVLTVNSPNYLFTLATPFSLVANTRYWIEATATSHSTAQWFGTADASGPGVGSEFFYNIGHVFPNIEGPYLMEVSGVATPEPASGLLLGTGLLGLGVLLWKRRALGSCEDA